MASLDLTRRWFVLPEVASFRRRLLSAYRVTTVSYIREKAVTGPAPDDRPATAEIVRLGRAGVRLRLEERRLTTYAYQKHLKVRRRRELFMQALDVLLRERALRQITVCDVLTAARQSRYAFYSCFASGLSGLYLFWATAQLDALTERINQHIELELRQNADARDVLRKWFLVLADFIMQKPYGRLPIFSHLAHEIDGIGSSLFRDAHPADRDSDDRATQVLDEYVGLAADLHRSGARLISTLKPLFTQATVREQAELAGKLWSVEGADAVAWNLALSFWQTMSAAVSGLGFLEAEREAEKHAKFICEIWCRGALAGRRRSRLASASG